MPSRPLVLGHFLGDSEGLLGKGPGADSLAKGGTVTVLQSSPGKVNQWGHSPQGLPCVGGELAVGLAHL